MGRNEVTKGDIYDMYNLYYSFKEYYKYYWQHNDLKTTTKEEIEEYKKSLVEGKHKLGGPIEALCVYARVSKCQLFNSDGTPKDLNEIEVLDMIMEANYGETNN